MDVPTLIWMVVVLKAPLVAALLLVWYAVKEPNPAIGDEPGPGGGSDRHRGGRPRHPRPPRRGPHVTPAPASPPRMRTVRGRTLTRQR